MRVKLWFGLIFIFWLNGSSFLSISYPDYNICQNTLHARLFVLAILPTLIIAWTAAYTLLSSGIVAIIAFAALFALAYFCMPVKDERYGGLFIGSLIFSLLIAFSITARLLMSAAY
jgi:heme/copper-type cytochrome/quinol oxidase subunit 4